MYKVFVENGCPQRVDSINEFSLHKVNVFELGLHGISYTYSRAFTISAIYIDLNKLNDIRNTDMYNYVIRTDLGKTMKTFIDRNRTILSILQQDV